MEIRNINVLLNNSKESVKVKTFIETNLKEYCQVTYYSAMSSPLGKFVPSVCEEGSEVLKFGKQMWKYLGALRMEADKQKNMPMIESRMVS